MEAEYDYIVVDDREDQREAIKAILAEGGFDCIGEAADGESGADLYFEALPDFVIMDIDMPGVDGIEGARMILEDDPDAFIIMASGFGMQSKVIEAISLGAKDFLVKPYMKRAVLEKVGKVLPWHREALVHVPVPRRTSRPQIPTCT